MSTPKSKYLGLSKSRIMQGLQCAKSLYLSVYHPELHPPKPPGQQAIFDQGHEVGGRAQILYPGGVSISAPYYDPKSAVEQTKQAIESSATAIFEGTFSHNDVVAKIDILQKKSTTWEIIEVKSTTSVKEEHIDDVAIQALIANGAGLPVSEYSVMHLNRECKAPDLSNLFSKEDVTSEVRKRMAGIQREIDELKNTLANPNLPKKDIGPHCTSPYECPFIKHCWSHIPAKSIFDLPGMWKKAWEYYAQGIISLTDPRVTPNSVTQERRLEAARSGKRWVDERGILAELENWKWPLHYLDFETIGFAIPSYKGTAPT